MSVKGAGGGANYYTQRVRGGYGTQMTGDFALTAGQVIKVAVGQCGLDGTNNNYAIDPNPQEAGGSAGGAGYSGGGGSVNNGSNQSNTAGFNNGNDQVIITRL